MGEVYRARDTRLGRDVAVKGLPASLSRDAERLKRFEQEARAASVLNHTNILSIFDVGSHESPYLVMELLEGETLRERLHNHAGRSGKSCARIPAADRGGRAASTDAEGYAAPKNMAAPDGKTFVARRPADGKRLLWSISGGGEWKRDSGIGAGRCDGALVWGWAINPYLSERRQKNLVDHAGRRSDWETPSGKGMDARGPRGRDWL